MYEVTPLGDVVYNPLEKELVMKDAILIETSNGLELEAGNHIFRDIEEGIDGKYDLTGKVPYIELSQKDRERVFGNITEKFESGFEKDNRQNKYVKALKYSVWTGIAAMAAYNLYDAFVR